MYYIKYNGKTTYGDDCYINIPAFKVLETRQDVINELKWYFGTLDDVAPKELIQALDNNEIFSIEVGEYFFGDLLEN